MFSPDQSRAARGGGRQRLLPSSQPGPAQALCARRTGKQPADPGAFCAALLGPLKYALPEDVDRSTWRLALEHFARKAPPEGEFRHLLELRARAQPEGSRDAGARVAAFLLREWERYGLARLLRAGASGRAVKRQRGPRRRPGAPGVPRALRLALRGVAISRSPKANPDASRSG